MQILNNDGIIKYSKIIEYNPLSTGEICSLDLYWKQPVTTRGIILLIIVIIFIII